MRSPLVSVSVSGLTFGHLIDYVNDENNLLTTKILY